ncbi:hypothetical protein NDU88_010494 [Pleurodeles waltl]|uniref:Uncharacterized protein n=1 Tax=Pleurodeles waltl TaxID=8319 RepID=A0AAV7S230_PLEWA|nr:hypothetical protein NDU88_010494 [Pleurodeles waltl]
MYVSWFWIKDSHEAQTQCGSGAKVEASPGKDLGKRTTRTVSARAEPKSKSPSGVLVTPWGKKALEAEWGIILNSGSLTRDMPGQALEQACSIMKMALNY